MLSALPPGFADHAAHDHRHLDLALVHVARLGGDIDQLVHRQHQKIHADVNMDRPHAGHRRPDRDPGHGVFGQRRAEHPLGPEFLDQSAGRALDTLVVIDIETKQKHARIAAHFLRQPLAERVDIGHDALITRRRRHSNTACRLRGTDWSRRIPRRRRFQARFQNRSRCGVRPRSCGRPAPSGRP